MKYFLTICLFLILPIILGAQEKSTSEKFTIILTNNSKLEGKIIEIKKGYVYFEVGNVVYTLSKRKIKNITPRGEDITFISPELKEVGTEVLDSLKLKKEYLKNGFYNISYGNIYLNGVGGIGVQNITGYQFSKYLGVGLGVGFISYGRNAKVTPIFSEFRGYLSAKKVSVYYNLAIGYSAAVESDDQGPKNCDCGFETLEAPKEKTKGGLFFHPAIGCKFGSDEAAFMIDLGIQVANTNTITESVFGRREEKRRYQRVVLRVGIML